MTPREVLLKAAELVERGWCQGVAARNKRGEMVGTDESCAASFCAYGAIVRAGGTISEERHDRAAIGLAPMESIGDWNDAPNRTQAEVVAALKAAAEACT